MMARYSDIDNFIWEDLQGYSKDAKLLYIYSFSNPSTRASGLYKIGLQTILLNTGLSEKQFHKTLEELKPKLYYDQKERVMFVAGKLKRHLSGLRNNKNLLAGIKSDIRDCSSSFVSVLFIKKYEGALKGLIRDLQVPLNIDMNIDIDNKEGDCKGGESPKAKNGKLKYLDYVLLTKEEHTTLIQDYGATIAKDYISRLNDYLGSTGKRYKSHYHTLRNWLRRDNVRATGGRRIVETPTRENNNASAEDLAPPPKEFLDLSKKLADGKGVSSCI